MVRGTLFGGFPWNLIGYAFAQSTAISQLAALTGIHGLSLLAVALGALPVVWLEPERTRALAAARRGRPDPRRHLGRRRAAARGRRAPQPVDAVHLRLVQANIAQQDKWQPEGRARAFERHLGPVVPAASARR